MGSLFEYDGFPLIIDGEPVNLLESACRVNDSGLDLFQEILHSQLFEIFKLENLHLNRSNRLCLRRNIPIVRIP